MMGMGTSAAILRPMSEEREGFRPSVLQPWEAEAAARLKALWAAHKHRTGQSQKDFGKATDIGSAGMVSQYINGTRPLNLTAALKFANGFGVQLNDVSPYLARLLSTQVADVTSNAAHAAIGTNRVPLINREHIGSVREPGGPYQPGDGREYLLTDQKVSKNAFALEIEGPSMLPRFCEGDKVIIDPEVPPEPGDFVAAVTAQNEATFMKFRPRGLNERGEEVFELVPLNEDFPSLRSDITKLRIIGTMVEHRQFRRSTR